MAFSTVTPTVDTESPLVSDQHYGVGVGTPTPTTISDLLNSVQTVSHPWTFEGISVI